MDSLEKRTLFAICDRLKRSGNSAEASSIYQGLHGHFGYPVLLDTNLLFEHKHILGPPGTGKTTLGLETDLLQLIYRNDGPVVIFDCKGDIALFQSIYATCQRLGRTFKWFTNKPYCSTYIFNPWDNRLFSRLSLPEVVGLFMQSLNLHHGEDYGRAFFQMFARHFIRKGIDESVSASKRSRGTTFLPKPPIQSFREFNDILEKMPSDNEELRGIRHLSFIVESLTDFDQLNLSPNRAPNDPKLANAIFMPDVIREKQVIYFYLVGAMDVASVAEIANLALYSYLMAAIAYHDEHGEPSRSYTAWDEAQVMIARNIENVLAQARSHGLACILAHQSMSQLNPPGQVDLRELILTCTTTKEVHGVRDPWLMQYISNTSGTTRYYRPKYNVAAQNALSGAIGVPYACPDRDGKARVGIEEYSGPRLTYQDILDISQQPNMCLMWIDRLQELSRFQGWFPVYKSWPVSKTEHGNHGRAPWPVGTDATTEMKSIWPEATEHTIVPQHHPAIAGTELEIEVSAKLRSLQQKLTER